MEITDLVNNYYSKINASMKIRGIPENNYIIRDDILEEAIIYMYRYKSNMLEGLNELNFNTFILNLKYSVSSYLKCGLTLDGISYGKHKIFDIVINDLKDFFKEFYIYISINFPIIKKLEHSTVESFIKDDGSTAYILVMDFAESNYITYHIPLLEKEEKYPRCLYNFNNHWLIFNNIVGRDSIIEFKIFIEIIVSIVNNKKYNIGFENNIHVGFILIEFFYISEEYKLLIDVADELCALANNIPRTNLQNFEGWLGETLNGRVAKNVI